MYYITRIELTNFKLVSEKKEIKFEDSKLIVLDGPNGYGKTTIFDAIEILIKGNRNIDNIYNTEYKEGDKPVVYANDPTQEIVIKGEFKNNNGDTFIIMRKVEDPSTNGKMSELSERFNTYELELFDSNKGKIITQEEINSKLKLLPDQNVFNLMYYIQQEDTTFFLRKSENTRREEINKLFNMSQATQQYNKIIKLRDKIKSKRREFGGDDGNGGLIKATKIKLDDLKYTEVKETKYNKLIKSKVIGWDKEDIILTKNNYGTIVNEISSIKVLINNFDDFINYKYNQDINYCLDKAQENILLGSFVLINYWKVYNDIKVQFNRIEKFRRLLNLLNNKEYFEIIEFVKKNIDEREIIDDIIDTTELLDNLKFLVDSKSDNNELSNLILNINSFRSKLNIEYDKFIKVNLNDEEICPFCGFDYKTTGLSLVNEVIEKEKYFANKLDLKSTEYREKEKYLEVNYVNKLIDFLQQKLKNSIYSKEFIEVLDKAYLNKDRILKFKDFCDKNAIDTNKYLFTAENYNKESEKINLENLKNELLAKKIALKNEETIQQNIIILNQCYFNMFDNDELKIKWINNEDIENKLNYIDYMFFTTVNNERLKLIEEQKRVKRIYEELDKEYILCKDIANVFKEEMRLYSTEMVKKLQIPLYIYSGKIIQDYQGGLGIFIKTEDIEQQIRLKFVNNNDSKHDLINKFSSGQLSGLVISLMLALNRVFSENELETILIDDPLQSMDDINMSSFVELLRNEFADSQIILSTHDERISRYIRYKFDKFGIKTLRYNVKDKLNQ